MKSATVLSDVLICPATLWREDSVAPESGAIRPRRRSRIDAEKGPACLIVRTCAAARCNRRPELRSADRQRRPRRQLGRHRAVAGPDGADQKASRVCLLG